MNATATVERYARPVQISINWSEETIIEKIRATFPETPNTAVAIARCESQLDIDVQSKHILHYGQEQSYGLFQIHKPDWHTTAIRLGYTNYKSDLEDNLAMARYIYDNANQTWRDWTCYNKGLYKKYL